MNKPNPYTCRLLRRIDAALWTLRGKRCSFSSSTGHLCHRPRGLSFGGWELTTHFPGWLYRMTAKIQNRWIWTRRVLSI